MKAINSLIIQYIQENNKSQKNTAFFQKKKQKKEFLFFKNRDNKNKVMTLIIIIILSLFHQIKSNIIFNLYHFLYSSKITLKVKGIGVNSIIGNHKNNNFSGINYLKNVFINGKQQDHIDIKYYFNQTENIVELIWDDNIANCSGLFCACKNITEINLSNFNSSKVTNMRGMFDSCFSLTSLDLTNLDTSQVDNMRSMFWNCSLLTSINLSNFNISQVTNMYSIFYGCSSLTSLDLSNFDTSKVTTMNRMFYGCSSLTSLNLSNFDTSNVQIMAEMLYGCSSLTSLDLSNFNTSQVINMTRMFKGCSSLTSLNLSNFNTLKVNSMNEIFYGCSNLEYINLNNFVERALSNNTDYYQNIFYDISDNAVICINEINTKEKIFPQINNTNCFVVDCSNEWKSKQKKIINSTNECIENCNENSFYQFEYNGRCYENCTNGFLYDENQIKKCKCELDECLLCPNVALKNGLCTECNSYFFEIEKYKYNLGEYIKCFKDPQGYYLDNNLYKECYYTCKSCNKSGNDSMHNCLECNDNHPIKIENNNYLNCFDLNYHIKESLNIDEKNLSATEEIDYYDNLIENVEEVFTEKYDVSKLDKGQEELMITEKMTITLTTVQTQKRNVNNKNATIIDLGECEELLRKEYNISSNDTLYMKKMDIAQDKMNTVKVEYDIYYKLFENNLTKLNLTICKDSKISIFIPILLTEHLDKLNISSGYYNDICYITSSDEGTDIILKDRQKEYIEKNKIICQEDCDFSEYNYTTLVAKCSCEVKESSKSFVDMKINKAKIFENFKNFKNIINFEFLICYKKLLKKEGIINNIGSYLLLIIIFFNLVTIFIFYTKQFPLLKKNIYNIAVKTNDNKIKTNLKEISIYKNDKKRNKHKKNKFKKKFIKDKTTKMNSKNKIIRKDITEKQINIDIKNLIDEEINDLSYFIAIKVDKRTYCQYYISLLKTKHNLICALFNNTDYNSSIIKINLFFNGFAIEYIVNALFYNDDTMHKIYENKGQFDFEAQIPIIIYSSLISMILSIPLDFLALSNDAIVNFKQNLKENEFRMKAKYLNKMLTIKFILYFIISFLLLICFWYYISIFCVIYKNTQIHLLIEHLYSFGFSLIIPFVKYLFPPLFRIPALSGTKKNRICIYNFSKFLQLF